MWSNFVTWLKGLFVKTPEPVIVVAHPDDTKFFAAVRKSFGKLSQKQVDGFNACLAECRERKIEDKRMIANILAQVWHESAHTMQSIEEYGRGKGRSYGAIDLATGFAYYGRGPIQLTWADNYKKMSAAAGVDLYRHPDQMLNLKIGYRVTVAGMLSGAFTGKKLSDYFNATTDNPIGARHIVNGSDRAELIAGYHKKFLAALT
jgi:hypothetical protein